MLRTFCLLALFAMLPQTALACSETTDCTVDTGTYHIALPEVSDRPLPAVMFLHGFGGSGRGVLRRATAQALLARGYAVIAPNGMRREGGNGRSWVLPQFSQRRDDVAFLESVKADAIAQHGIDPEQVLLSGFSLGGVMVAYTACAQPEAFTAYAPIAGNLWRPHPESCAGPVPLLHTHGWQDGTVPLEGRILRGTSLRDPDALIQGDIFVAMAIWRDTNGCDALKADRYEMSDQFWRRKWERCSSGAALEFALFPGGHTIPDGWVEMALAWFEGL